MQTGTVKFFNEAKGYGFIKVENSTQEVFVHATDLKGTIIKEDDYVEFETSEGKKGLMATDVKVL